MYLNGRALAERIDAAALAEQIEHLLGNRPAGERTVLLKVDRETPAASFEPVTEAVSRAGGDLVHVVEQEGR